MSVMAQPDSSSPAHAQPPQYRAPAENRQSLVTPSLAKLLRARHGSETLAIPFDRDCQHIQVAGVPLSKLRRSARRDAWQAAIAYTRAYRDVNLETSGEGPWLVAGHQPELFHPGVWFKNFLLSQAASHAGAVPLNLVIDNDLCRAPAVRVLANHLQPGSTEQFRTESVEFDSPSPPIAWECRSMLDYDRLRSFPERLRQASIPDLPEPLVGQLWPLVLAAARRTGRLGLALAQGRHRLEEQLGLRSLELPLSQLCSQTSFARFSLAILADIARFQQVYNQQRSLYCQQNGIRSLSHPVPALSARHGWLEAPWWVYRQAEPTRRRLFVRLEGQDLLLSDQAGWQTTIEGPLDSEDAVADWQNLASDDVLLRPRALITTLFARLVISDLFMHGIGGGKYDQMTDAIIAEYYGIAPPQMVVATATLHLQLGSHRPNESLVDNRLATQQLQATAWNLRHHPEAFVESDHSEISQLLQAKQRLLQNIPPRGEKWQWHHEMKRVNERLAQLNQAALQQSQSRLQELAARQRQLKLAFSREFSFCLFELGYVSDALKALAAAEFGIASAK